MLKSGKDQSLKRFHPWVFSGAIKKIYDEVAEGDLVLSIPTKMSFWESDIIRLAPLQCGRISERAGALC